MSHSPLSPVFVPCDFLLFPKLKVALQRRNFNMGNATQTMMTKLTANPK
jgi:hypothetical protein